MKQVALNATPIRTSAIGFGCGSLTGAGSKERSLELLNAAYDSGITHFDVAPSYGYGVSEILLGEFSRNKRKNITITSKYGIQISKSMARNPGLINFARKVAKALPFVKKILRRSASSVVSTAPFTPADAQISLDQSLKNLQTDYLDAFLLHEADVQTCGNPDFAQFLESQIKSGKIRAAGVGSEFSKIAPDAAAFAPAYSILQFQSNLESPNLTRLQNAGTRACITHGSLRVVAQILNLLAADPVLSASLQALCDAEPSAAMPSILIELAAAENPCGITLFASKNPGHILETLRILNNAPRSPEQLKAIANFLSPLLRPPAGATP